jgi:ribosome-associated toxin RatA of RatAB toxin-antitoxin module
MPDYERSAQVKASADALFDYLSDIRNLPKYFSSMTSAKSAGPDEVKVTAKVHGKEEEGKAKFQVDKAAKKLKWSSEGPNDYHGELEVTEHGNSSKVAVKLHTERAEKEEIERGLQKTVDNIVRLVEENATKAA